MRNIFQAVSAWFNPSKMSDEEFIELLRQSMAARDRWRGWLAVFYALFAVTLVGVFVAVCLQLPKLMGWGMQGQNAGFNFTLGFILGLILGGLTHKVILGVVELVGSLSGGYRSERLLIRYYDAIRQFNREAIAVGQKSENH